jgi:TraM recognition site of TraD and TraG
MISINHFALTTTISILTFMLPIAKSLYFVVGFALPTFILVGRRLTKFTKPNAPYLSNIIRAFTKPVHALGNLLLLGIALLNLIVVGLAYLGGASLIKLWLLIKVSTLYWLGGAVAGLCVALPLVWRFIPQWECGAGFTDAPSILARLRKLNAYDPLPYIKISKGCFIGRSTTTNKPIYIPWQKINQSHMQCLGTTSSGKNVEMLLIVYQCVLAGQGLVWIDPKEDLRTPEVLLKAAKAAGKKLHFIHLGLNQPSQFNLLEGCAAYEIEELFVAGFDLQGKGGDGDFYRGKDQDAAILAAQLAVNERAISIPQLYKLCAEVAEITNQENFWRLFKKLASLPVIQTDQGLDLEAAILAGEIVYIVGSCDNERVKTLQKMLLIRVMQIIKKRDRTKKVQSICVVLDEFKHLISPTVLNALAVVRDFNAHFLLAHQSIGDLDEASNVSRAAAYGAVVNNTSLKVIFKIGDVDFAKDMAELAGHKTIYKNNAAKSSDSSANATHHATGSWSEAQDYRIPPEVITGLPIPPDRQGQASVGVFYGVQDALIFYVGHIQTSGVMPTVNAATTAHQSTSVQVQILEIKDLI